MAVDDAGDQGAEAGFFCERGEVAEGGVGLKHGVGVSFAEEALDLIVVVHDPQAAKADSVSGVTMSLSVDQWRRAADI